jgi:hypothetical protein
MKKFKFKTNLIKENTCKPIIIYIAIEYIVTKIYDNYI